MRVVIRWRLILRIFLFSPKVIFVRRAVHLPLYRPGVVVHAVRVPAGGRGRRLGVVRVRRTVV